MSRRRDRAARRRSACRAPSSIIVAGLVGLEGGPVDAVGGERVEDVRDRRDPALERDLVAPEAGRVAGSVDPLVVRERHQRREVEQLDLGAGEDPVAHLRVPLHHRALVVGQPAGLEQDPVRDPDLADVVHRARDPDHLRAVLVDPRQPREQGAVEAHPDDVLARLLVAELGRPREAADRLLAQPPELGVGGLELLDRLAQGGRPLEHRLLQPVAVAAVLDLERAPAEGVADVDDQLVRLERLQDVAVGAVLGRDGGVAPVVQAGDHHDRRVPVLREHLAREVEAGLAGHVDVAQDEAVARLLQHPPSLGRALGGVALVAVPAQEAREQGADLILVVDDQHPLGWAFRLHQSFIGS